MKTSKRTFAVIYRGFIKPGLENNYQEHWKIVAEHFIDRCGAIGSTLHKTADGMWLAYSRWPDKETRDAVWNNANPDLPDEIKQAIASLKLCMEEEKQLPEICMEIVEDI